VEEAPRVFVSYSHDSATHKDRVRNLADQLRADGIDAVIDQYVPFPPEGWPDWCDRELAKARFVLMICTETYLRRINHGEEPGKGHGVLWEARLIKQHLYDAGSFNGKFVPVLFAKGSHAHVPTVLRGATVYRIDKPETYEALLWLLTDQPFTPPPQIGPRKILPPRKGRARAARRVDSEQIVDKFASAIVHVHTRWRLYDRETGKPLFQKTVFHDGRLLPAYVKWNGNLYRWLTFQDELKTNFSVGSSGFGTGFVIDKHGLTLINTHVAAGWLVEYFTLSLYETGSGVAFNVQNGFYETPDEFLKYNKGQPFKFDQNTSGELVNWRPEEGGPIFAGSQPVLIDQSMRAFEGKNEELSVRPPGSRVELSALFVLSSTDVDVALIRIAGIQVGAPIPLAVQGNVKLGQRVTIVGFPTYYTNIRVVETSKNGQIRRSHATPNLFVTEGIVSSVRKLRSFRSNGRAKTIYHLSAVGDVTISGAPVFNNAGRVIGVCTYRDAQGATFAIPVKYTRDLIKNSRQEGKTDTSAIDNLVNIH
jgi:S1-C subfamily serine protease